MEEYRQMLLSFLPTVGTLKFSWKIKNFSKLEDWYLFSDISSLGPYKWRIFASPKVGYFEEDYHLSIYLQVADSETLPSGWTRMAKFSLTVINQINKKASLTRVVKVHEFKEKKKTSRGFPAFISHKELYDLTNGYLVKDTCIIEADVTIYGDASVESGKDEPTKEDMEEFFGDLNSVMFPKKVVSSEEEAKEALAMIEEVLNMVPADVNNPGRMSQLRNAFDVLSSLDEESTILSMEQKEKLLSMKENITALPQRAVNAVEDIKLFSEKELVKKTLDHKLVRCLVDFEKAKAETVQNEQDITILQEQIGEMKQKKEISFSKQKEMFKLSKELKAELDVLVKNWPEYEARMNAAEKEEMVVGTEWTEMKQFYSSLKPHCALAKKSVTRTMSTRSSRNSSL